MARHLVFNGDADGLCAAQQLRLAGFVPDHLVTGVKRDIALLERVDATAGDTVHVADISLDSNRAALTRLLDAGVQVAWHDHHFAGEIPAHPGLAAHIDTSPDTCSSLIVDALLNGRFRAWAVAAAYGDNLHAAAHAAAQAAGMSAVDEALLREFGELVNYNAYGESEADLCMPPLALFSRFAAHADPRGLIAADPLLLTRLRECFARDMAQAHSLTPTLLHDAPCGVAAYLLPDAPWARRVNGVFANELAREHPERAHAVLVEGVREGTPGYMVSVRAPTVRPAGADAVCRQFASGGGRSRAAGINWLPKAELPRLGQILAAAYP
ncbi:MAG: acetyltransferase [Betaproteobacteria bacterium]|nr:acetyltransferase [Betaproteobacteria bacterium]